MTRVESQRHRKKKHTECGLLSAVNTEAIPTISALLASGPA